MCEHLTYERLKEMLSPVHGAALEEIALVRHLVEHCACPECAEKGRTFLGAVAAMPQEDPARAWNAFELCWSHVALLISAPVEERRQMLEQRAFSRVDMVSCCVELCRQEIRRNPELTLKLADLAVELTEELKINPWSRAEKTALACAWQAKALQVLERYEEAEEAARRARENLQIRASDEVRGEIMPLLASVYRRTGSYRIAKALLRNALPILVRSGDSFDHARACMLMADLIDESDGSTAEAVEFLDSALEILDEDLDRELHGSALLTRAGLYIQQGNCTKAFQSLSRVRPFRNEDHERRRMWFWGKYFTGSNQLFDAENIFRNISAEYAELGMDIPEACVCADLACVLILRGKVAAGGALARWVVGFLESKDSNQEVVDLMNLLIEKRATPEEVARKLKLRTA